MRAVYSTRIPFASTLLSASMMLAACGGGGVTSTTPAATTATAVEVTSIGSDFYLTLPEHICVTDPAACKNTPVSNKLNIASATATTGEVTFNGVTTPFSVSAGSETEITLDAAVVLTSNETVEAKGIHVTSLTPVSVHVISENAVSADGYMAMPTPGLGTNYYVMSYASSRYIGSEFAIVSTQDNTNVTITPTASGASRQAGTAFTVTLNIGETYQFQNPEHADLTGTLVTADKPIGVFSGHRCADIPSNTGYCDYLVEQIPDVTLWGKTFHTSLFNGHVHYMVRIIASMDGTTFTTQPGGLIPATLNAGQYVDVELSNASEIISSNPVLMAQYMRGFEDDSSAKGDPSMVLVTPAEMGMTDTTFGVHGLNGTSGAYMNIVTETSALANLKLDNVVVSAAMFTPMGGTSTYSVGTIPVTAGSHALQGTVPYRAIVYDYGISWNAVSYAYPVSSKLSNTTPASISPPIACNDDIHRHKHARRHREYCLVHHVIHPYREDDHDDNDDNECHQ